MPSASGAPFAGRRVDRRPVAGAFALRRPEAPGARNDSERSDATGTSARAARGCERFSMEAEYVRSPEPDGAMFLTVTSAVMSSPAGTVTETAPGEMLATGDSSGRSKASTLSPFVADDPCDADAPRPRRANAAHSASWCTPRPGLPPSGYSAASAARIASRPSTNPGLHGCSFSASVTNDSATWFPAVPSRRGGPRSTRTRRSAPTSPPTAPSPR